MTLDPDELIELIFRIVDYVYNPANYQEEHSEIPKQIMAMMEEPVVA